MIIDTHAHLDQADYRSDIDAVVRHAEEAGVEAIVSVGLDEASSRATIDLAEKYSIVWAAVGLHPNSAGEWREGASNTTDTLRTLARHPRVMAIGETGLDFHRDRAPRDAQIRAFRGQLELAAELGLPIIIHQRDAYAETMDILKEWVKIAPPKEGRFAGVLHCFANDVTAAKEGIALGFAISIAGPITYPRNDGLVQVVRSVPASALVAETDCPFLAPQRVRGRRNEPAYVKDVVERIAQARSEPFASVARATTDVARRLFNL